LPVWFKLALNNSNQNIVIEADCATVLESIQGGIGSEVCMFAKEIHLKIPHVRQVILARLVEIVILWPMICARWLVEMCVGVCYKLRC
jgi:hypothetical protein